MTLPFKIYSLLFWAKYASDQIISQKHNFTDWKHGIMQRAHLSWLSLALQLVAEENVPRQLHSWLFCLIHPHPLYLPSSWTNSCISFRMHFENHHRWEAFLLSFPSAELGASPMGPMLARCHTVCWMPKRYSHQIVRPLKAVPGSWLLCAPGTFINKYKKTCTDALSPVRVHQYQLTGSSFPPLLH